MYISSSFRGLAEDPKWQCTTFVLTNYKTDQCRRPPRLCRQGYACPQYHNNKDRRRSPKTFKYRSTPCPNVKHGDEWGEPTNCESGDHCAYCHTRTEQQFHPEIYKSTKCNDMLQVGGDEGKMDDKMNIKSIVDFQYARKKIQRRRF